MVTYTAWLRMAKCGAILLILTSLPCSSQAQTTSAPTKTVTLEDALNYALQNYPAVRASLEQVNAAHAGIAVARAQYLPSLTAVYQDSRATQNQVDGIWLPSPLNPAVEGPVSPYSAQSFWASQIAALFSWEPFDFGLRQSAVDQAKSAENKSNADLAVTRLQVASAVGNYFLAALAAHQAVVSAQANISRWEVINKSVHTLVDNGLRPGADASRADAQLAGARAQFYQAQQEEQSALATLASLMGAAGTEIATDPGRLLNLPATESLPVLGAAEHPLARDLMASVQQTQAQENVLNKTDYPRFFLQAEGFARGSEVPNGNSIIGTASGLLPGHANWLIGITVTFPNFFDFKSLRAQKEIARATENSQRALYDKSIQDISGQVQTATVRLKNSQLIAQQTPIELSAARTGEIQSRARYEASLATIVEVADAEGLLAHAEMDDALARLNVWRSLFVLAYAQGNLQPFLNILR